MAQILKQAEGERWRDDPRTGKQTVTVTHVDRSEPNQAMFEVPAGYKVVDENPEN